MAVVACAGGPIGIGAAAGLVIGYGLSSLFTLSDASECIADANEAHGDNEQANAQKFLNCFEANNCVIDRDAP